MRPRQPSKVSRVGPKGGLSATQLDKGEALHGLREFLLFANRGKIRRKQDEQAHQAVCLNC
jgi:hypothetical protein